MYYNENDFDFTVPLRLINASSITCTSQRNCNKISYIILICKAYLTVKACRYCFPRKLIKHLFVQLCLT